MHPVIDLGLVPFCQTFLPASELNKPEKVYPLELFYCEACHLCQIGYLAPASDLFTSDYAYFSSYSTSWLKHAAEYVDTMKERLGLNSQDFVVEIASNDGYLLQNFVRHKIPCLGIDPAEECARAALEKGVPTITEFLTMELAEQLRGQIPRPRLMIANNVLAHVPNIRDFVRSIAHILHQQGVVTFEFPHLLNLIELNQFDTIYHEHYSYLSLTYVQQILAKYGLEVFDVEELASHGGSLRVFAQPAGTGTFAIHDRVDSLLAREAFVGLTTPEYYDEFGRRVLALKRNLLRTLFDLHADGKKVAAYGAAGKGSILLNYCGIKPDLVSHVYDRNPHKQGKFVAGVRIPVRDAEQFATDRPDAVLLLAWNLHREIDRQLSIGREWNAQMIVPVPSPKVVPIGLELNQPIASR